VNGALADGLKLILKEPPCGAFCLKETAVVGNNLGKEN